MPYFTAEYIQTQIEFFAAQLQTVAKDQAHEYTGPAGNFDLQKGSMAQVLKALQFWIDQGKALYPDTFNSEQATIEFWTVGINGG